MDETFSHGTTAASAVPEHPIHAGVARRLPRTSRRTRKYVTAFRVSVMNQLAYPGELWMRTIFLALIMFIFSSLWHTTYGELGKAAIGGFDLTQMLWYLAITESIVLSRARGSIRIDEEVRTGDLAYALVRPYNFVLYRYAEAMGERVVRLAINLAVALPLALLFSGGVGIDAAGLVPGLVVILAAVTLDYLMVVAVQLLAFWVEDTAAFLFIYDRFLMILGGVLLPIGLFPGPIATLAQVLPFSSIINGPSQTLIGFDRWQFLQLLGRQSAALVVAALAAALIFRVGVRRISANGG